MDKKVDSIAQYYYIANTNRKKIKSGFLVEMIMQKPVLDTPTTP